MTAKLLTGQYLEFLSFTGGCTDLSESTLVKMPHCWKSHVTAHTEIYRERSGSVVEFLSKDRGVAGSSLTAVTALCP